MKRLALLAALAALAVTALAAPGASAKPATKTCVTRSENVISKKVIGTLAASNVDPSQQRFATCATAQKVMSRVLSLRFEKPTAYLGFRCTPTVTSTGPDVVNYKCVFKGADTATYIRLLFTAHYDED